MKAAYKSDNGFRRKNLGEEFILQIEEWLNDIRFSKDELKFFCRVIDTYHHKKDNEVEDKFDPLKREIIKLETQISSLQTELEAQRQQLSKLDEDKNTSGRVKYSSDQTRLQAEFNAFVRNMRSLKEGFFRITDEL